MPVETNEHTCGGCLAGSEGERGDGGNLQSLSGVDLSPNLTNDDGSYAPVWNNASFGEGDPDVQTISLFDQPNDLFLFPNSGPSFSPALEQGLSSDGVASDLHTTRLTPSSSSLMPASLQDTSNHSKTAGEKSKELIHKRQRNKIAAQKYRKKKMDRIAELEQALEEAKQENNALELRLARRDAEISFLKGMLNK